MGKFVRRIAPVLLLALVVGLVGCSKPTPVKREPKVTPPAIKTAGELAVGVDMATPPFAGSDQGRKAGLDVDVASALAEQLGLSVRLVNVKPSDAATALANGKVDAVMSVPLETVSITWMSLAGTYAYDGPAFFISTGSTASVEPSLTVEKLTVQPIGVQRESAAYWFLLSELDPSMVKPYDTLRDALDALVAGEVPVVAGDAFVGAYIARDMPGVHFAGQIQPATALSVAVGAVNTPLGDAVRSALDDLAADGVLDTLRRKWVGDLPQLSGPASSEETATP